MVHEFNEYIRDCFSEAGDIVIPTGSDGKFKFKGQLSVFAAGGGVNEVVGMTITIAPSTPITMDETV